ncbi:MAG TPA: aromatic ring-opening dioxygenase LigA [Candidatus Dormibacteraeota bacterium]
MARHSRGGRVLAIIVLIIGAVMVVAGGVTWFMVQDQLSDEKITVADDADFLAGDKVDGPFSAYAQADIISKHALEATKGKTYAQLGRDDPIRQTAMSASFLRASLYTSVVAFGVAVMAVGLGIALILIALALMSVAKASVREAEPAV